MKVACFLLLLLTGCATVTPFEIKNDFLFDPSKFREATAIGISIYNNSIKGFIHVIEFDCMRFAGYEKEIKFYELSKEMVLTPDYLEIQNLNELSGKYPDIKYIFAVFEHNPKIKTKHYKREESESVNGKEKTVEYEYRETTLEVPCEIMLFEWTSGELIAKAKKSFKETKTNKRAEVFPDHTLFGFVENVVDGMGSGSYPHIKRVSPDTARYYFYHFLKDINNQ